MKKLSLLTTLAAVVLAGSVQTSNAQVQTVIRTDEALVLDFELTVVAQGATTSTKNVTTTPAVAAKLTSADVVQALGVSLGQTFSSKAQLVLLTPTNNLEFWHVYVEDGTNVTVDVSGFFSHQPGSPTVDTGSVNSKNGNVTSVSYGIDSLALQDNPSYPALSMHFSLSGFTAVSQKGVVSKGVVVGQTDHIASRVSGMGDANGNLIMLRGTYTADGIGTQTIVTQVGGTNS